MRSLAFKLTLAFLLVSLAGAALVAVFTHQSTRSAFGQFIVDQGMQNLAVELEGYYAAAGSWEGVEAYLVPFNGGQPFPPGMPEGRDWRDLRRRIRYTLVGADGVIVFCSEPARVGQAFAGDVTRALALEVNGATVGWLVSEGAETPMLPFGPEQAFLLQVNRAALLSALIAGALALALGGLLAHTLTRGLRALTEAAGQLAQGKLGVQVQIRAPDELGALAAAFNRMSVDLQRSLQSRRQMTADIAHDLRSPLSVITGYAEALNDGKLPGTPEVYGMLHQEALRLNRLVEDLRLLSLADAGELRLERQEASLPDLLERILARHAIAAQQKELALRLEAASDLPPIMLDVERIAQALDNLLLNAFRHTPPGGEVRLSARLGELPPARQADLPAPVRPSPKKGAAPAPVGVLIQAADTGPGIAAADLPFIFERFYRGDKARPHTGESGLGLAIARSIVQAHGGAIWAENRPEGGARFSIWLPVSLGR